LYEKVFINMEGAVKFVSAWVTKGPKLCVKKKGSWFRKKTFCVEAITVLTRLVCMDCVPFVRRGTMGNSIFKILILNVNVKDFK
jgi:hypothetical protein